MFVLLVATLTLGAVGVLLLRGQEEAATAADVEGDISFADRTAALDGVDLHYVIGGSGPAVILIPGFPETWYAWRKVMPALAAEHTVIAVDPPGVGGSSVPGSGYEARAIGDRLSELIETLGISRASVIGHDLGGWSAYAFARFHPDQADHLAILDAGVPGFGLERRLDFSKAGRGSLWHLVAFMQEGIADRFFEGKEGELVESFLRPSAAAPGTFDDGALEEYVRAYSRPGRLDAALGQYRAFYEDVADNRAGGAPRLSLPVLALGGERSRGTEDARQLQPVARDVRGGVVPGAGHFVMEEQPGLVADRLLSFLDR